MWPLNFLPVAALLPTIALIDDSITFSVGVARPPPRADRYDEIAIDRIFMLLCVSTIMLTGHMFLIPNTVAPRTHGAWRPP